MPPILASLGLKGILASLMGLALIAAGITIHFKNSTIDNLRNQNAALNAKLSISNASIDELQKDLDEKNAESEQRAKAFQASLDAARHKALQLQQQAKATQDRIDRLNALAGSLKAIDGCKVPKELNDALGGL